MTTEQPREPDRMYWCLSDDEYARLKTGEPITRVYRSRPYPSGNVAVTGQDSKLGFVMAHVDFISEEQRGKGRQRPQYNYTVRFHPLHPIA